MENRKSGCPYRLIFDKNQGPTGMEMMEPWSPSKECMQLVQEVTMTHGHKRCAELCLY